MPSRENSTFKNMLHPASSLIKPSFHPKPSSSSNTLAKDNDKNTRNKASARDALDDSETQPLLWALRRGIGPEARLMAGDGGPTNRTQGATEGKKMVKETEKGAVELKGNVGEVKDTAREVGASMKGKKRRGRAYQESGAAVENGMSDWNPWASEPGV